MYEQLICGDVRIGWDSEKQHWNIEQLKDDQYVFLDKERYHEDAVVKAKSICLTQKESQT